VRDQVVLSAPIAFTAERRLMVAVSDSARMSTSVFMTGGLQKTQFGLCCSHNAFQIVHLKSGARPSQQTVRLTTVPLRIHHASVPFEVRRQPFQRFLGTTASVMKEAPEQRMQKAQFVLLFLLFIAS
jgi:hypothetical protein